MNCSRWKALASITILILLAAICPLRAQRTTAWADFQEKAAAWRALPVKPALSEEVRRERVLAENAVREKEFKSALDHYESGLKMNPVWPEGHFNAALIDAELKNYDDAVWHMRAYLELVPNASDAQGARDQIVIWQDKQTKQVWVDPATKLMWTKEDNGSDVNWSGADSYCRNLRMGGYSDWRVPSIDELEGIYDPTQRVPNSTCSNIRSRIKGGIALSGCEIFTSVWSSSLDPQSRIPYKIFDIVNFGEPITGATGRIKTEPDSSKLMRALCVRHSGE